MKALRKKKYNEKITSILNDNPIRKILFTSKNVYTEFLEHFENSEKVDLVILPSPSPVYRRLSMQDKAREYKKHFPSL